MLDDCQLNELTFRSLIVHIILYIVQVTILTLTIVITGELNRSILLGRSILDAVPFLFILYDRERNADYQLIKIICKTSRAGPTKYGIDAL